MKQRAFEFRCPIYGFVTLSDWEREIISQPAFQRLRRISQLAFTHYVYPGAMHTRFEHSLGVMHMATKLYDGIRTRSKELLKSEFSYNEAGFDRYRVLVRLAALLHDVGHAPFSHAGEELFPPKNDSGASERYVHEDYSAAVIRHHFKEVIEKHPDNGNYGFTADNVAALLKSDEDAEAELFWRALVTSQMDADRMDYLLRDSHHAGVDYGRFDWHRLVQTVEAVPGVNGGGPTIGVSEGGWHAAEALILARYFMFTQVYFHKTRVIYDHHLQEALREMLPGGRYPPPDDLDEYLEWDDWKVFGALKNDEGGEHGRRIIERKHYREIWRTPEAMGPDDKEKLEEQKAKLGGLVAAEIPAEKESWYSINGSFDIPVRMEPPDDGRKSLSSLSSVVRGIESIDQIRLYARPEDQDEANRRLSDNEPKTEERNE